MKINHNAEIPKQNIDDYTKGEQKLIMLMGAVRGTYETDYFGMEKAITIRANFINAPKIDALAELSGLSKNIIINDLLELAFYVLQENLSEDDAKKFTQTEREKLEEWISKSKDEK